MKRFLLVGAIGIASMFNAQSVSFGANAGMLTGFATVKVPQGNASQSQTGFYAGLFLEGSASEKFKVEGAVNYANIDNASALQIPLVAKYYVDPKFNLQFGPQFLFDLEDNPLKDYYNTTNFALALGAAYEFTGKLFLEGRYSIQLNNHFKNAPSGYSAKANYLNLGLGYRFK